MGACSDTAAKKAVPFQQAKEVEAVKAVKVTAVVVKKESPAPAKKESLAPAKKPQKAASPKKASRSFYGRQALLVYFLGSRATCCFPPLTQMRVCFI